MRARRTVKERIHHIEVVNMDREWYGTYTADGKKIN